MSSDLPDSKSLRKVALTAGFVLMGVSIAGVTIPPGETFQALGIPLRIARPNLLPFVFAMASVYATFRFIFYTIVLKPSPMRSKRRLQRGSRADTSTNPRTPEELFDQVTMEVHRFFPRVPKHKVRIKVQSSSEEMTAKITIPKPVLFLSRLEDLDFLLPVIVNVVALGCWSFMLVL